MRCRVCQESAVVDVRRHNAAFCHDHFVRHCRQQVERAIAEHKMLDANERILVAVSGGKDSLALWEILLELGYEADGVFIGLGIDGYSDESSEFVDRFVTEVAGPAGRTLSRLDLPTDYGYDVEDAAEATGRPPCSACGLSKRHLFNKAALDGGYDAIATGHNLDDEAAVLFGNTLRWHTDYLRRQRPVLPDGNGFPRKVKPMIRLSERESAAYCILKGIDYQVDECPMSAGNTHLQYKGMLNSLEESSPGTKAEFYGGFLRNVAPILDLVAPAEEDSGGPRLIGPCVRCDAPTDREVCSFCRLVERVGGKTGSSALSSGATDHD